MKELKTKVNSSDEEEPIKAKVYCSIRDKDILTIPETLAYAGISEKTLRQWRERGLSYLRDGSRIFLVKEEVKKFMLENLERVGGRK